MEIVSINLMGKAGNKPVVETVCYYASGQPSSAILFKVGRRSLKGEDTTWLTEQTLQVRGSAPQVVMLHLQYFVQFWNPWYERDKLERVHQKSIKVVSGLEPKFCKERLREMN